MMRKISYWIGLLIFMSNLGVANAQSTSVLQAYITKDSLSKLLPPQDWEGPYTEGKTSVFKKSIPIEEGIIFIPMIDIQANIPSDLIQSVNVLQQTPTDTIITPLYIPFENFYIQITPLFSNLKQLEIQLTIADPATELSIGEIIDSEDYVFGAPGPNDPDAITSDQWRKQADNSFTADVNLVNTHKKSLYIWETILVHKDSQLSFCNDDACKIRSKEDYELVTFFTVSNNGYAGNIELTAGTTGIDDLNAVISNLIAIDAFDDDEDVLIVVTGGSEWEHDQIESTYQSIITTLPIGSPTPLFIAMDNEQTSQGEYYWTWSENINPNEKIGITIGDYIENLFPIPGAEFRFPVGQIKDLQELYLTNPIQIKDYAGEADNIREIITHGEIYLDVNLQG